jgi:hypothetical protein
MYRRNFIRSVSILSLSIAAFPSILISCGQKPLDKQYAELIAFMFSQEISKAKGPLKKKLDILIELIKHFPQPSKKEKFHNISNPFNSFNRDVAVISFYDKCKEFYIQDSVTRQSLMWQNIFEYSTVPFAFASGFVGPWPAAALSTITFLGAKSASFFGENYRNEIIADPYYLEHMNSCIISRALDYGVNNEDYNQTVIRIDPNTFGLNQEKTVRDEESSQNKILLDSFKNRVDDSNLKHQYLNELEKRYAELNKSFKEMQKITEDQNLQQNRIAKYNYYLKEAQGATTIITSFMRALGNEPAAQTVEKLSQGLITLFTALNSPISMGPFATTGMVINAFSILSSMFGSSGPDVNAIIVRNLNEIRSTLRDIQIQLNRIEKNQVITYEAIVWLINEFERTSYSVQLSLQEIREILLLQSATDQDTQLRTKRQLLSDLKNTYVHLVANYSKKNDSWFGQYDTLLTNILNYAKNSNVLFTGSERAITSAAVIPSVIDKIGYLDLMISCLPKILRLNGLKVDFSGNVCNPYEWSLAAQAYIELRLEHWEIKVPSDKKDIMELVAAGIKIRTLIKKTINKDIVDKLTTSYRQKINPDLYKDVLQKYRSLQISKITKTITIIQNQFSQTFGTPHLHFEQGPILTSRNDATKEIMLDTTQEEVMNIKPEKIDSLIEYLADFIHQFESKYGAKNYSMNPFSQLAYTPNLNEVITEYYGHMANPAVYSVKNDPLRLCINSNRQLIKMIHISGPGRKILVPNRYKLIETKSDKEIFPGSFFYEVTLGTVNGEEWLQRYFHINTDPFMSYGLDCNPKELLDYCYDLLCEDYMQKVKGTFSKELREYTTKHADILQPYVNLFYTLKLVSNFSLWRKATFEPLPVDKGEGRGFSSTPIILESEKTFHFNNIPSLTTMDSLIAMIDGQINIQNQIKKDNEHKERIEDQIKNSFDDPKGSYKMDLLQVASNVLNENLKLLSDICNALPITKTLPVVDHTLLNLLSFSSLKRIRIEELEEII